MGVKRAQIHSNRTTGCHLARRRRLASTKAFLIRRCVRLSEEPVPNLMSGGRHLQELVSTAFENASQASTARGTCRMAEPQLLHGFPAFKPTVDRSAWNKT